MSRPRTFTKRIYLDSTFNRNTTSTSNHWAGTTVKAFRVLNTNNNAFDLNIVADPDDGSIQGIPLGAVRSHNYATLANNAVFENTIAQPGVYVDILISVEDNLVWTDSKTQSTDVNINEGSSFTSTKVTATAVTSELIPANDKRSVAVLQWKSGTSIWIGKPADLADADYQNICYELKPGETLVWKNAAAVNGKTASGSSIFSLLQELK